MELPRLARDVDDGAVDRDAVHVHVERRHEDADAATFALQEPLLAHARDDRHDAAVGGRRDQVRSGRRQAVRVTEEVQEEERQRERDERDERPPENERDQRRRRGSNDQSMAFRCQSQRGSVSDRFSYRGKRQPASGRTPSSRRRESAARRRGSR